jgi:hypothetical protein
VQVREDREDWLTVTDDMHWAVEAHCCTEELL